MEWLKDAACRDIQDPLFISSRYEDIELAKEICETCPVMDSCMLHFHDASGVIAGTSDYDRLVTRWKRVENVRNSNWRPVDFVLKGFVKGKQEDIRSG